MRLSGNLKERKKRSRASIAAVLAIILNAKILLSTIFVKRHSHQNYPGEPSKRTSPYFLSILIQFITI